MTKHKTMKPIHAMNGRIENFTQLMKEIEKDEK